MKFVLDTNIILKALIKDSAVRGIIVGRKHQFFIPQYAMEETRRHVQLIEEKSGLSEGEINSVLELLLANIRVIPASQILSRWEEAEEVMAAIDKKDTAFLAAALSLPCDGIWSDDKHLARQSKVKVWRTKDVIEL